MQDFISSTVSFFGVLGSGSKFRVSRILALEL